VLEKGRASGGSEYFPHDRWFRFGRVLYLGTPLYSEPCEDAPKAAYLRKGALVEVLAREGSFLQVRTEQGGFGYLRENSVSP
jgi:hypothetical protein